jgi:hypothetical protein
VKRKELADVIAMLDLAAVDEAVIARAKDPCAVTVRALDALHRGTGGRTRRNLSWEECGLLAGQVMRMAATISRCCASEWGPTHFPICCPSGSSRSTVPGSDTPGSDRTL